MEVIKTLLLNFQSFCLKQTEIAFIIDTLKPDVMLGTETWLKEEINNSELLFNDYYEIYRKNRQHKIRGDYAQKRHKNALI